MGRIFCCAGEEESGVVVLGAQINAQNLPATLRRRSCFPWCSACSVRRGERRHLAIVPSERDEARAVVADLARRCDEPRLGENVGLNTAVLAVVVHRRAGVELAVVDLADGHAA